MTDFDPVPSDIDSQKRWHAGTDTFGRVYDTLLGITTQTSYTEIAAIADCSPNAAKKHLDRLVEMGIAQADSESRPARYERNDGYLEWQEASRIARELSVEDILERVERLEAERAVYEERFDTTDPATVSVFDSDGDDHTDVHGRMTAIATWHGIIRDIRLYELARRLAQNDGHLIPA